MTLFKLTLYESFACQFQCSDIEYFPTFDFVVKAVRSENTV